MSESTTTEQKGRFKIKNVSKTTIEEGAMDSAKLPRSDTPTSVDGTNISTDRTTSAVAAAAGSNKADTAHNTPAEMTIETQVVKKKSRFTVKTVPNEDVPEDRSEQSSAAAKQVQQPQQANLNPLDKSDAASAAAVYGKMEALMQANMRMMAQLMEATKRESNPCALPGAPAVPASSKLSVDTNAGAAAVGSSATAALLSTAVPLTRTLSRERETGSAPSPQLSAAAGAAGGATGTAMTGTPTSHTSASHFPAVPSSATQALTSSNSVPANSLSTDEKDVHFNKLSHYLTEMKRELDLAQKQRKDKALESQRLREKCQQLEDRLRSEQKKISRLEEQANTFTATTDALHMEIASLNETVAKQNTELNKYRTAGVDGGEIAPTGSYLPQPRSNGSLHSAQSALSDGSALLPLAASTSGTQLSLRDTSSEALTGRSTSAGGQAPLLSQSRSGGNMEEYFVGSPPVSPPQNHNKHLSRGNALSSVKSGAAAGVGGSDKPLAPATSASDPEGAGQSQYRKKSLGHAQPDLQMKQMLEKAVNNINPSKPSPTITAAGSGGGSSSGAASTGTGLHASTFSSGNGTPIYRPAVGTSFKPLSAMGNPASLASYTSAGSAQQQQMSGMSGQSLTQSKQQQHYTGYPQQIQQQQQSQQHIYPMPAHQQQDAAGRGGYGGHCSPASFLGSNAFPLQQPPQQHHHHQQHLGAAAHHSSSQMQKQQQHSGGGMPSDRDSFSWNSSSNNNSTSTIGSSCIGKVRDELDGIAARSSVHSHSDLQQTSSRGGGPVGGGSSKGPG